MIKIKQININDSKTIPMRDMEMEQVGIIDDPQSNADEHVVFRVFTNGFEVIDLTDGDDGWNVPNDTKVRLLGKGESVLVEFSNE